MADKNVEDIKSLLERITGSELTLKKQRKSEEDLKRELFEQIIISLEKVNNRSLLMEQEFSLSHFKYDESFHEIIDALLMLTFGPDVTNLILFYLYDRVNPDQSINTLMDEENNIVALNNPNDLYIAIQKMTPPPKKKKK